MISANKPTILVVEPSKDNATLLKMILEKHFTVILVNHVQAVEIELQSSKHNISLVTTALMMPNIDGLQLVRFIRKLKECDKLPILCISASLNQKNKEDLKKVGCTHSVVRPISADTLIATINQLLNR